MGMNYILNGIAFYFLFFSKNSLKVDEIEEENYNDINFWRRIPSGDYNNEKALTDLEL